MSNVMLQSQIVPSNPYAAPIGILPGTELLNSPVRTEFSTESFHAVFIPLLLIGQLDQWWDNLRVQYWR